MPRPKIHESRPPTARFNPAECEVLLDALQTKMNYETADRGEDDEDDYKYWDLLQKLKERLIHNINRAETSTQMTVDDNDNDNDNQSLKENL